MAVLTYAIGDVHGSYTKVANLLRHCNDHCGGNDARFVFLGDYVDRGKRSRDVVNFLIETQAAAPDRIVCLLGNHEEMLLNAASLGDEMVWLHNGGDTTLQSYGVDRAADIPAEHLAWLEGLPYATSDDKRFFVHAGIMPGIPLAEQRKDVMLWIREPFLSDENDHGRYVVHGHTPTRHRNSGAPPQPAQPRHLRLVRQSAVRRRVRRAARRAVGVHRRRRDDLRRPADQCAGAGTVRVRNSSTRALNASA